MLLRVKHKQHTHRGVTYRAGEVFEGTGRLLAALPDRLEAAPSPPVKMPMADPLDALRAEAEELGITVDKRWGEKRLRDEIAAAKNTGD